MFLQYIYCTSVQFVGKCMYFTVSLSVYATPTCEWQIWQRCGRGGDDCHVRTTEPSTSADEDHEVRLKAPGKGTGNK